MFLKQFSDKGARDDDAVIDIETVFAEPGFVRQIGGRQAVLAAAGVDVEQLLAFVRQQSGVEERLQAVERQVQRVQRQVHRLVPGIVAAVAKKQAGGIEAADGVANVVADGEEFGLGSGSHG
ncbi:hypothetical protein SDC9_182880 [bioreactor metagenome]|uniref:Uncharacterized protein n=1 Tax=bioreactor metagenome TaxID=1076179 RepID=A0A645HAJ2_9ZZZZ